MRRGRKTTRKGAETDWTLEETRQLVDLHDHGHTLRECADKLNRTESSVTDRWRELNPAQARARA